MASVHPLPEETGNENTIFHPNSISGSISRRMMQTCRSPALVTPLATAFPPIEANMFIPNFRDQRHLVSDKFTVDRDTNGTDMDADGRKQDKEHKKRSKNWTRAETLKLIKLRTELASKFARTGRKSELWDQIASGLQQEQYFRDAQQCRDKWEKLMAGYKEVKDGHKDKQDYPFYEELHPLLSGKSARREIDSHVPQREFGMLETGAASKQLSPSYTMKIESETRGPSRRCFGQNDDDDDDDATPDEMSFHKRKRCPKHVLMHADLQAVQAVLETVISCQQKIFKDFLETRERNEQQRQQMREAREEKWRAEERAQTLIFNNAMLQLAQKLVEDKASGKSATIISNASLDQELVKRSKNWRRFEVLELIKSRAEMDSKFSVATRRAALWDEISGMLNAQGIKRDGKQCREKWEKLVAEFKDVRDGKKEPSDSPYFQELITAMGMEHHQSSGV